MSEERLSRIEAILERAVQVQESNARTLAALADQVAENARQQNQSRSDIRELANDFYQVAGEHAESIDQANQRIEQNNERIDRILEYLGSRNGGSNPPQ